MAAGGCDELPNEDVRRLFTTEHTYRRRRPRRDPAKTRQDVQSQSSPGSGGTLEVHTVRRGRAADRSVRVLEETLGLLVRAHPLHADLLQGGAGGVALLPVDEGVRLLLVQEHCAGGSVSDVSSATG